VEFHSFELNPNAPAQQEGNLEEALARKYGVSLEQARAMNARVVDAAAGEATGCGGNVGAIEDTCLAALTCT